MKGGVGRVKGGSEGCDREGKCFGGGGGKDAGGGGIPRELGSIDDKCKYLHGGGVQPQQEYAPVWGCA